MDETVGPDPHDWSPDMRFVIDAIAKALKGKEPCLSMISDMRPAYMRCIARHTVEVGFIPMGREGNPRSEYWISVDGERINAIWTIRAEDLHRALKCEGADAGASAVAAAVERQNAIQRGGTLAALAAWRGRLGFH
jgi:hypothetical protein